MKIRMLTTSAGPDPALNWHEGQKRTVDDEEGQALVDAGVATSLEPVVPTPADEPDFSDGGYRAHHRGRGVWEVLDAQDGVVSDGLNKDEAQAKVEELNAAAA
jgi:hypothetical protein